MFVRAARGQLQRARHGDDRTEKGTIASAPLDNLPGAVEAGAIQRGGVGGQYFLYSRSRICRRYFIVHPCFR